MGTCSAKSILSRKRLIIKASAGSRVVLPEKLIFMPLCNLLWNIKVIIPVDSIILFVLFSSFTGAL